METLYICLGMSFIKILLSTLQSEYPIKLNSSRCSRRSFSVNHNVEFFSCRVEEDDIQCYFSKVELYNIDIMVQLNKKLIRETYSIFTRNCHFDKRFSWKCLFKMSHIKCFSDKVTSELFFS